VREGERRCRRRERGVRRCIEFGFGWGRWVMGVMGVMAGGRGLRVEVCGDDG